MQDHFKNLSKDQDSHRKTLPCQLALCQGFVSFNTNTTMTTDNMAKYNTYLSLDTAKEMVIVNCKSTKRTA